MLSVPAVLGPWARSRDPRCLEDDRGPPAWQPREASFMLSTSRSTRKASPMMRPAAAATALLTIATVALANPQIAKPTKLALPGGEAGIGFDDLMFSSSLHRVIAPAGRTGKLDLIDPATLKIESISGFSADSDKFGGGHGEGTTSADSGGGFVFASDRSRTEVALVDTRTKKIVAHQKLAGGPDYVRWVAPLSEVWVTEPGRKQIEFFALDKSALVRKGALDVAGGPESLVIDATRGRAYTHSWDDES